jgi:predicted Zn-dependent protease
MSRVARWSTLALVIAGSACEDIAPPLRTDIYEWRLIVTAPSGSGADSLTFHWPRSSLPVKIWVEDAASLPQNMPKAIAAWRAAFLYDEFDATIVSDSSTADVIVRAGSGSGTQFGNARLGSMLAPQCQGVTDLDISDDLTQLRLPVRIFIDPGSIPDAPGLADCLALTTTHELGHALGIWRHSDDPTDIMFEDPVVPAPSERDLSTAEVIYHLTPNVVPVRVSGAAAARLGGAAGETRTRHP